MTALTKAVHQKEAGGIVMAWRTPTKQDLAAKLSNAEIEQFRKLPDYGTAADPVDDILKMTAAMVRGYIRKNKQVAMSPGNYDLPESLISPAMDCAAFDLLKRMPGAPTSQTEWRGKAYEQARAMFDMVAKNEITPESHDKEDADSNKAFPKIKITRRKILNERL